MMDVGTYATTIQARAMRDRESIEEAYDTYPESMLFWGFVDLQGSSNFRLARGAKEGYIRAETFFSLVRGVIAPCEDLTLIKEIGDEVMLSCSSLRPLLEAVLLLDQSTWQLSGILADDHYPFSVRAAIGFGSAKRLVATRRSGEDYVGSAIDELARIMSIKDGSPVKMSRAAHDTSEEVLAEYSTILDIGPLKPMTGGKAEQHFREIYYRDVTVDRKKLGEFRSFFAPWKRNLVDGARRHA